MDNLDDSETTAKVSDSAYSNSCSNSQSRRSHSSKSTHSGSNSSGSSGYGGKPSTSGSSNTLGQPPKKEKEIKKKKLPLVEAAFTDAVIETEVKCSLEPAPVFDAPTEELCNVAPVSPPMHTLSDKGVENMEISTSDRNSVMDEAIAVYTYPDPSTSANYTVGRSNMPSYSDGFSCVISMHDGVVMYTTSSLTVTLGFPKDMWIGRSFIDFIHPKDQKIFASQITIGLAVPPVLNGTQLKVQSPADTRSTMVCRIRRYRGLATGFGVKDRNVSYMPFLLKLAFKNVNDEEGKVIYLVIQAIPFYSAFRIPNEPVINATPFVLRHAANGNIEYVASESVPYLGYLPQDLTEKDALMLYHPDDLSYLRQVYETIVKEGGLLRSKVYRMLTQNGDYVRLETEWSSFINPWSKKLEFVIGKHHLIEGPTNPDVFDLPSADKAGKVSEDDKNKAAMFREAIIRIMNEVPTKPAEVAKQQMTKRCQDVALFMESLMEEQPKTDEELRLEIQDPDNSYYERDSVMLGGISPHHDHNDSKSSTETPLSYNQLNYHETLQRYFDSHQAQSLEVCSTVVGENVLGLKDARPVTNNCLSPMAQYSGDSVELSSSAGSNVMVLGHPSDTGDSLAFRLTEFLLNKHNSEMEKELMKMHREIRTSSKGEREKATNETRQKKKEHLARCNASFQPTSAGAATADNQPHGVKRSSKYMDSESKHHYPSQRHQSRRQRQRTMSTSVAVAQPITTITATHAGTPTASFWPNSSVNNMNTFILGVGIPQQMSFVSPVPAMPGMFPMYYAPAAAAPTGPTTTNVTSSPTDTATMCQPPAMQCMMYGQPMYGSPFVYPMSPQMSNPFQQTMMGQTMMYNGLNPLGLTNRNYEEACKPNVSLRSGKLSDVWRDKKRHECNTTSVTNGSAESSFSTKALNREFGGHHKLSGNKTSVLYSSDMKSSTNSFSPKLLKSPFFGTVQEVNSHPSDMVSSRIKTELADSSISKSTEAVPDTSRSAHTDNKLNRFGNSEEAIDRTDGESSYSSFYSSFFKTESGSAEESGDAKKNIGHNDKRFRSSMTGSSNNFEPKQVKKVPKRNMDPPWLEKVCVTSELIYKYQILTKSIDEVLIADKQKLSSFEQPTLVNDQLGQLYLDMQLEGQAARLTLEEGITSSSSSGEESATNQSKNSRRRREYSKLTMIYEEDAPLPPSEKGYGEPEACGSTASPF